VNGRNFYSGFVQHPSNLVGWEPQDVTTSTISTRTTFQKNPLAIFPKSRPPNIPTTFVADDLVVPRLARPLPRLS
jgi:hypothetical protein